jgi:hypothetical protein
LKGLTGVRVGEVGERGGLQASDLVAVVGPAAFVVVQADIVPGQAPDTFVEGRVVSAYKLMHIGGYGLTYTLDRVDLGRVVRGL